MKWYEYHNVDIDTTAYLSSLSNEDDEDKNVIDLIMSTCVSISNIRNYIDCLDIDVYNEVENKIHSFGFKEIDLKNVLSEKNMSDCEILNLKLKK